MERSGYHYDVEVKVKFSRAEVEALCELAESHYDYKCKSLVKPDMEIQFIDLVRPGFGAFLNGMKNTLNEGDEFIEYHLTIPMLDILCKVLETSYFSPNEVGMAMWFPMTQLFKEAVAERERING